MELVSADRMLREKYVRLWPFLIQNLEPFVSRGRNLSHPLLISLTAHNYTRARVRLLVVGQQTRGWRGIWQEREGFRGRHIGPQFLKDPEQHVDRIIGRYRDFNLGQNDDKSPFWETARALYASLNPHGPDNGFLWSNLIKIDEDGKRPVEEIEHAVFSAFNVLPVEIGCAKPDVVVFFTGPTYDGRLLQVFPGAEFVPTVAAPLLDRVKHDKLPEHTYRTYHPQYLRMKKSAEDVIAAIAGWVDVTSIPPGPAPDRNPPG